MFSSIAPAVRSATPVVMSVSKTAAVEVGKFGVYLVKETVVSAVQAAVVYTIMGAGLYGLYRLDKRHTERSAAAARKLAEETGEQIINTKAHEFAQTA